MQRGAAVLGGGREGVCVGEGDVKVVAGPVGRVGMSRCVGMRAWHTLASRGMRAERAAMSGRLASNHSTVRPRSLPLTLTHTPQPPTTAPTHPRPQALRHCVGHHS